jgi:hypothetical protein
MNKQERLDFHSELKANRKREKREVIFITSLMLSELVLMIIIIINEFLK